MKNLDAYPLCDHYTKIYEISQKNQQRKIFYNKGGKTERATPFRTTTSSSVVGVVIERWGTGERRRGGPRVDSLTLLVPIVILLVSVTVLGL